MKNALETIKATTEPVVADVKIGGNLPAKQYEITATTEGIKAKVLFTCVENEGIFYQIMAWSLPSKYAEAKPVFEKILNDASFN